MKEDELLKCNYCGCVAVSHVYAVYMQKLVKCPSASKGEHIWKVRKLSALKMVGDPENNESKWRPSQWTYLEF